MQWIHYVTLKKYTDEWNNIKSMTKVIKNVYMFERVKSYADNWKILDKVYDCTNNMIQ